MADATIQSFTFIPVTTPASACKMQVHDAPVCVTFTSNGETRGLVLQPGDVIPIAVGQAMRARKVERRSSILSFEVFG